ncbi:hypothetical protein GCM10023311_19660 [Flaviramulus aquimarinus]|uniref:Alpha-ketoglutarate decarboxylase n=1 Tax=Flaviramulus aquimarinus TaxID=1170456 RepID=A0ABP9F685_9FLAO
MNLFFIIKKKFIVLVVLLFSFQYINAQDIKNDFWSHVRYGGNLGISLGDGFFSGTIAPSAIYEFDKNFALGISFNATFNNQKNVYKSTILGGSLIGFYNVIKEFQLSAEFEELHVNRRYNVNLMISDDTYWSPALFFGAGYRNGNVTFGMRYDVLYDRDKSIYFDPWMPFVRFYF